MELREKVIKGLECCLGEGCDGCEYEYGGALTLEYCKEDLMRDALALLKAQEAMPVHVTAEINCCKIGECPTCWKPINSGDYPNYCGACGQAVKWE